MAESSKSEAKSEVPAREPGAPFPKDAIDPDLVRLPRARTRIGPLLSFSVLVFCGYMMVTLWDDFRFWRAGDAQPVDEAGELTSGAYDEGFVTVPAVPDRSFAAQVYLGASAVGGHRLAPVLGTSDRVWLYAEGNEWTAEIAYNEEHTGRVRSIDELPLAGPLRDWVAAQPPAPRYVTAEAVRHALEHDAALVATPAGSAVPVAADTPVAALRRVPARAELRALITDDRPDAPTWTVALRNAGVLPPDAKPFRDDDSGVWFDVPAPGGVDAIRARLTAKQLFAVEVEPLEREIETTWDQVAATGDGLRAGDDVIDWGELVGVAVWVRHEVPDDALVVLTDQRPEQYWYLLPLYIALAVFFALFAWALVRTMRGDRAAEATT